MLISMTNELIGVILHEPRDGSEELLERFAFALRAKGVDVGGLVQRNKKRPNGKADLDLIDVRTEAAYPISQDLGAGSSACCLDPRGLAEASGVLRREIDAGVALLVVNKFSTSECEGDGVVAEIFEAITRGIPVLTSLSIRHLEEWNKLTDGAGTLLDPKEDVLWCWWEDVCRAKSAGTATGVTATTDSPAARDAFAPADDTLKTEVAIAALVAAVSPVGDIETVPLFESYGRVLAEDLVALRTVPPCDNSAVDGYAVRSADLSSQASLPVGGRIAAGHPLGRAIRPGEALRIFTGAPIPEGADAVVAQESAELGEDSQVWLPAVACGANLRPAGEDFSRGDVVLPSGKLLLPQDVGHAASAGHATLAVRRRPRVLLFATGDEVCEPGGDGGPESTVNSNMYTLFGLVRRLGCEPVYLGILPDRPEVLKAALAKAAGSGADLIMTTGGVSVGEEDHIKAVVESLGALNFWRIAIRPGRPLAFGRVGDVPFLGLPGNPVAATVTFLIFARPLLLRLAGATQRPPQRIPVAADFSFKKRVGRREWLRGSIASDESGHLVARRFPNEGSGIFSSVVASGGLIELHEEMGPVKPGDTVQYLAFSDLLG